MGVTSPTSPIPLGFLDENTLTSVDTGSSSVPQQSRMYQELLDANPYRNLTYNQSGWQKFLSGLGFRTSYDDFREQAQLNAAEYDADILSMRLQNEYNDPVSQARRMQAAGMNADLLGTEGVAEAAAPRNDQNGMDVGDSNDLSQFSSVLGNVASFAFKAVTTTFAMLKDYKALKGLELANEGQEIANGKSLSEFLSDVVWKTTSPDKRPDPASLSGPLDMAIAQFFPDAKSRGRANAIAKEFAAGLPQDAAAWKAWHERAGQKVGYASIAGSEGFDEQVSDAMLSFYGFMQDLKNNATNALNSLDISNADETIEFNATHDATAEANAANEGYAADQAIARRNAQEAAIAEAINSTFEKWCTKLEQKANSNERGHQWASIALALIGLVRLTAMSGMSFSTSRGSRSSVSEGRNGYSTGQSSNSGFSFGF